MKNTKKTAFIAGIDGISIFCDYLEIKSNGK